MIGAARPITVAALLLLVVSSALGVVYAKHESRKLFAELQRLRADRDSMDVEWGQLQLEQSTQSTHQRIEAIATKRLDMASPDAASLVIVRD